MIRIMSVTCIKYSFTYSDAFCMSFTELTSGIKSLRICIYICRPCFVADSTIGRKGTQYVVIQAICSYRSQRCRAHHSSHTHSSNGVTRILRRIYFRTPTLNSVSLAARVYIFFVYIVGGMWLVIVINVFERDYKINITK